MRTFWAVMETCVGKSDSVGTRLGRFEGGFDGGFMAVPDGTLVGVAEGK